MDFSDVRGQETVKRALIVALAGKHSITLIGPTGWGKTMLADRAHQLDRELPITEVTVHPRSRKCPECHHIWEVPPMPLPDTEMYCEVPSVPFQELFGKFRGSDTASIQRQLQRCSRHRDLALSDGCLLLLKQFMAELMPHARGVFAAIRIARTIANLDGSPKIAEQHIAEAVQYRLDRSQI